MQENVEKPEKAPGALRRPIKEKRFDRRFIKYIEHPNDRQFFTACFDKQEGKYVIRTNLNKDEVKKLKNLLNWIKKNRKVTLKIVPLAFAGAVVAALVIFFTVFANPLLERALEKGLEAIFEAKSDVDNFRLSLLRFRIAIGGVTVANRDSPMKNLFQMGRTEIRLKPEAILRGKIYIEEIRADTIRFGTARTVSGALPAKPPKEKKAKPPSDEPPMIDLQNFNAMALLEREYNKLKTPKLYDAAIAAYNETAAKWQGQVDGAKDRVAELRTNAQPILNLNVNNIRDIETVTRTVQDINTMITSVQSATDDVTRMVNGIETDINNARQLEQSARTALTDDIGYLKSFLDLGSGAAFAALEPSIREILSDTAEQYFDYGLRALEIFETLKAQSEAKPKTEKPKKEPKVVFKGRDVNFPLRSYPKFFLGILASDFTLDTWNWAFDLRDVSSNPDLTGKPVSLALGLTESGGSLARAVNFKGSADFRTNPPERFNALVSGSGFPVKLGNQLNKVGINGFSGETAFSVNMKGHIDGGISAGGDVRIGQAQLIDPSGLVAQAVDTAIREAGLIALGIQYIHHLDQTDEFKITTNIADLIAQALRRTAEAYAQKAMQEIEKALRDRIDQYIDGKFVSKEEVDLLFKTVKGDKDAMDQMKNALNSKRTEFEQKIRGAADAAVQQVKEETTRQAEQAVTDILQGQTPSVPSLPSLPGGGTFRLPGR
jgi:uncharacterized protein (TIGR03545 family)